MGSVPAGTEEIGHASHEIVGAEGIPLLVASLVEKKGAALGKRVERIARRTREVLMVYDWPGKVRRARPPPEPVPQVFHWPERLSQVASQDLSKATVVRSAHTFAP